MLAAVDQSTVEQSAAEQPPNGANGNGSHPVRTSLYILLAEDNPVNQRVAARLLEKRGHRVSFLAATLGAGSGVAGSRDKFDLILMDVQDA